MSDTRRSLSQLEHALEHASSDESRSDSHDNAMLNHPGLAPPLDPKGKRQAAGPETIFLDSSDEDSEAKTDLQLAIERSIVTAGTAPRSSGPPHPSTSRNPSNRGPSTSSAPSKKHPFNFSDSDDSDLEILACVPSTSSSSSRAFAGASTSTPTAASSSRLRQDKKPRIASPSPQRAIPSSSVPASIKALRSSVMSLVVSYSLRRTTRPEFISKKLQLRDEARELGVDFDDEFGDAFDQVEVDVTSSDTRGRGSGRSLSAGENKGRGKGSRDVKGKGRAISAMSEDENHDDGENERKPRLVIDRRMTSAQVRAKQGTLGGGGGGFGKKGPRTNAEILAMKKREWDQAKIVPLSVANASRALGGNGVNREAMERAKRRQTDKEARRRRDLRRKGSKRGIDGWLEGALAGPALVEYQMPGAWGPNAKDTKKGGLSDSNSSGESDDDYSAPDDDRKVLANLVKMARRGRKAGQALPAVNSVSQESAAFHRRQHNASMRSTNSITNAVAALGMKDKEEIVPGMRDKLLDFQWIGLAFMAKREMDPKVSGGILADEMGLGKTVQTIALMMARRSHDPEIHTNLVVVPLSLLSQWEDEIEKFAIGQSVHIYHGSNKYKTKSKEELLKFDVVITTHSTLLLEWPKSKKKKKKKDGEPEEEEDEEEKDPGLLFQVCWYRVVIDEAHVARNPNARISKAISKLDAVFRWALTGTPMINSLRDYYPLHRFLRNRPWKEYKYYQKAITVLEKKHPVEAGRIADGAIGPLTLRRRKTDQLGGKALVELPPKSEKLVNLDFDDVEREIYDHIEAGYQTEVNKFFRAGTLLKNFHFILVLILRLKQLAVHPHLMAEKVGDYNRAEELARAKIVMGDAVVERLEKQRLDVAVKRATVDDVEDPEYTDDGTCPVCDDPIVPSPGEGSVTPCGHVFCTTCVYEILNEPAEDDFVEPRGRRCKKGEAPCPLCRAPFSTKDLFDLDCFEPKKVEIEAALRLAQAEDGAVGRDVKPRLEDRKGKGKAKQEPISPLPSSSRILIISDDDDDDLPDPAKFFDMKPKIKPELQGEVKPKLGGSISRVKREEKDVKPRFGSPSVRDIKPLPSSAKKMKSEERKVEEEEKEEEVGLQMSPLVPSTKMLYILKKLRQFEAEDAQKLDDIATGKHVPVKDEPEPDTRTIILSQFVGALDLLDRYLTENGIMSVRFQGSTSAEERREAIRLLGRKENGVKVMLLSTKAGGVGLNLTSACRVLSLDLAWSKAVEAQAFDRTYRLGQTRAVEIERVIVRDTIEERILNLQARKTLLSDMSLAEGQGDPDYVGNISVPDILSLFRLDQHGNREDDGAGGGGGGPGGGRGGTPRGRGRGGFRGRGGGRGGWYRD